MNFFELFQRSSLASRFSRTSRVKPEEQNESPKIVLRRETGAQQSNFDVYGGGPEINLPDEYLMTLSDDSGNFRPSFKNVRNTVSDYCSSDWESDTDSEMEPEEVKKEEIIGKSLLIGIIVYLGLLITAYIFTTVTPLCVCHPDHPDYSTTSYKQLGFYHGSIKFNVGFLIAYAVQPPTPSNIRPCITPVV